MSVICDMTWLCALVMNIRHLWHDMTCLCDMITGYPSFVTWYSTNVWHEYWISGICDMTLHVCDFSTEYQTFVTWHDCVIWVLNIRHLWLDMAVCYEYWISDICDMIWLCEMNSEYQIFVTIHDCVSWI